MAKVQLLLYLGGYALPAMLLLVCLASLWPLQRIYLALSWLPLAMWAATYAYRDSIARTYGYGGILFAFLLGGTSLGFLLVGIGLQCTKKWTRKERLWLLFATLTSSPPAALLLYHWR